MNLSGETKKPAINDFESGLILGVLVGEGHFGGDSKQPQVSIKMHLRHETLLRWLVQKIPGSKLYGPYTHAARRYYQWMVRGEALRNVLIPLLDSLPFAEIDPHAYERYQQMKERYGLSKKPHQETDLPAGIIVGLLLGEGHFGGDGKQPHVVVRRHVRHQALFQWLLEQVPGSRLYGPYSHGERHYYQWTVRGEVLKNSLMPLLESLSPEQFDISQLERYQQMKERYRL